MACTIDATVGGASANSYATIDQSTTYHETHIAGTAWDEADSDAQCRALQTATRLLDQWYEWDGVVATATQALLWPRIGAIGRNGYLLPSDAIPVEIEQATCELARQLLAGDRTADSDIETQGIRRIRAGSVDLEFSGGGGAKPIPDAVQAMVGPLGRKRGLGGDLTLRRA